MWRCNFWFAAAAVLALTGCKVGPDYVGPDPFVPDVWHRKATEGLVEGKSQVQTWWKVFDDPMLDELIGRAGANNLDLK